MAFLEEFIFAGFGGQGILSIGQVLAYGAIKKGLDVAWIPAYGPESRGGTAYATVIVSDEQIGSPTTKTPTGTIIMNGPSYDKFIPMIRPNGVAVINADLCPQPRLREDVIEIRVNCQQLAKKAGSEMVAAMVALGAFLNAKKLIETDMIEYGIKKAFPGKDKFLPMNMQAIEYGRAAAEEILVAHK